MDARDPERIALRHSFFPFQEFRRIKDEYLAALMDVPITEYYKTFVSYDSLMLITNHTNLYATQQQLESDTLPSRVLDWKQVDTEEILNFLGIAMYKGLVRLQKIEDYWSTDSFYKNKIVVKVMSRNRFQLILKFIHFVDR